MNELADLWTDADSVQRQSITAASQLIDRWLSKGPETVGESRSMGRRIMFVPPLVIIYRVEAQSQTVSVLRVQMVRRRGQ